MGVRFSDTELEQFVESLEKPTIAKVLRTIDLIKRFGHTLGMPHSKHIGGGLFELRIRGDQEIRLIYTFYNGMAVLLHGFLKKSQKIPRHEIDVARQKLSTLYRI